MCKIYAIFFIAIAISLVASAATPAPTPKPATPAPTPQPATPAPTPKPATAAPTAPPAAGKYGPGAPPRTQYDYIIIGAGETGSVVAKRLTDDSRNFRVLVLEAGFPSQAALGGNEYAAQKYNGTPGAYIPTQALTVFDIPSFYTTTYNNGQELYQAGTHIPVEADWGIPSNYPVSQGKIVGGSGCHNGMVWVRATPGNLAAWNVSGWSYTDLLPYFIKSENATLAPGAAANPTVHGFNGPLLITPQEIVAREANITVQSTINAGYPGYTDPNSREDGSGVPPYNIRRGVRDSTAVRYLLPNLGKSNLDVITYAQVTKMNFAQTPALQAGGVTWTDLLTNTVYTATAAVEVIFAAGPLNTPKILMWSGYGPADELAKWQIPLKFNNTNVGRNIRNFFGANLNVQSPKSVYANLNFVAASALQYAQSGTGYFATAQTGSMTWISSNASLAYPDIWFNSHYFSTPTFDALIHGFFIGPSSPVYADGFISINSSNPLDPPSLTQPLLTHPEDIDTAVRGFGIVRQILATEPAASFFGPEITPGANVTGAALRAYITANLGTVYHYTGSCKMGNPGDPKAVVDNNLKLINVFHARIVDTSVFAGPSRTNFPHATCIAIAEKASVLILNDAPSGSQVP